MAANRCTVSSAAVVTAASLGAYPLDSNAEIAEVPEEGWCMM